MFWRLQAARSLLAPIEAAPRADPTPCRQAAALAPPPAAAEEDTGSSAMILHYLPPAPWPLATAGLSPCPLPGTGALGYGGCWGCCGALLLFLWSSAAVAAGVSVGGAAAGGEAVTGGPTAPSNPSTPPRAPLLPVSPPGAAAGGLCYSSPSVGSVQELAQRSRIVIEGRVQGVPGRALRGFGEGDDEVPPHSSGGLAEQLHASNDTTVAPSELELPPAGPSAYLVKVHQVWAVKAGGLRRDTLLWLLGDFGSCLRLKEDSKYIFFMEPSNSSGSGPEVFRALFPPLETGRNLKKEVSRVLCRGCGFDTRKNDATQQLACCKTFFKSRTAQDAFNRNNSSIPGVIRHLQYEHNWLLALPPRLKAMKDAAKPEGTKVVLKCEAISESSLLQFKWQKDGKDLNKKNSPENVKIKDRNKKKSSELHINRASQADAGEYTCTVTNKLGNDTKKANVEVMPVTTTPTIGTGHLIKCNKNQRSYCVNGGECFVLKDITSSTKYVCKCQPGFAGARCLETVPLRVIATEKHLGIEFMEAEELYQKRVLTITGICIALLVVGIMCVVAYCKTKKQRKKLHDRFRHSLRSERNNMVNMANGPHHPNPPQENVQLQYVSKNMISSEHVIERETETSFSTSHYTSTTHHSTTVTQTPSHSWSNGQSESIISESHSVLMTSSVENSRHTSPAGPRGRLNGIGGPRDCNSFLRHARDTPDSYRDSPHSERYVSAMTTPARMSPVDFQTPCSPRSPISEVSPPVSILTVSVPSVAVSPFIEEERPLLLVSPPRLREKRYDHYYNQQFHSYHHNPVHDSSSLPPSPLRIVEDEEYETTQEYEPIQEPTKKPIGSRRAKRTKPNGHISNRLEMNSDTSSGSCSSESETEDEKIGEDTPFLSIQNPLATSLDSATAYRLTDSRTNPTSRFSTQEDLQARLSSVIANQDPVAV
ncbi:pro-neuregulin-1, membrane-bound isoform isoform X3 [Ambystoma mexicanum]|uniref:pro-neuregulin-1, membrane-bound isoform isoform X3 n=1 Tax=Ambystoma mexicanum TaxID=8296 RepID=UPI0037E8BC6A